MREKWVDAALAAVRAAGERIRQGIGAIKSVRFKGPIDLVTETDEAVEAALRESLGRILPEADFYGEESASGALPQQTCWIVDPVDGTTNYAHGLQHVAVSVALWQGGRPVFGVVYLPVLDELFWAVAGGGAYLGQTRITVSATGRLEHSLVATGFPYTVAEQVQAHIQVLGRVLPRCQGIRRLGSAATDLAYVACGRFEGFYEAGLKPWDVAAGWLLVEEAGGRVTDAAGAPFCFEAPWIVATNGRVHAELVSLVAGGGA